MDGCKLVVISGIDGDLDDFYNYIQPLLDCKWYRTIKYDRSISFKENISLMKTIVDELDKNCCVFAWSIGAVAAAFIASCDRVKTIIMVNAFFCRSEVLKRRNINCEEEVCISDATKQTKRYIIIAGMNDDKIPYTESVKIAKFYDVSSNDMYFICSASHSLSSFPQCQIASIINNSII